MKSRTIHRLNFQAAVWWTVGAGGADGCIVLGEEKADRLHVYTLHENGEYMENWTRDLPQHITADCWKTVTAGGDVLLQEKTDARTVLVNRHGVLDTWQQEGELIGCLYPRRVVYQRRSKEKSELLVREEDGSVTAADHTWRQDGLLSVCGAEEKMAVTESLDRTLSIFSTQGNSQNTTQIPPENYQQKPH